MNFLFDMDGVLVDSKEAWFRAFREVGGISREEFDEDFWGRDLQANLDDLKSDKSEMCDSVLRRHLDSVELVPGAREVLAGLDGRKALVTNTTEGCTRMILRGFGLEDLFDAVLTSDQVTRGKPDPSLLRKAMRSLGSPDGVTVMVGDSEEDMQAGRSAGCITVGIGVQGDYTASSLRELPGVIAHIRRS
jgi:HAD superfamily hydrolase (TIGR01509 family)